MPEPIDSSLVDRYLAGECLPSEVGRVQAWIAADPDRRNLGTIAFHWPQEQTGTAWARVATRLGYRPLSRQGKLPAAVWHPIVRSWDLSRSGLMLATSFVIAVLAVWGWSDLGSPKGGSQYVTGAAQVTTIQLRDGSQVTLAPHTTLSVANDFGAKSRNVTVVGEAYFDVNPSKGRPFVVHSNGLKTRVLGTQFVVRNYPSDAAPRVSVREGKVAVGTHVLTSMQEVVLNGVNESVVTIADFSALDFTTGWLSLDDTPLHIARLELNRWYDADIRIEDSQLDTLSVSGDFEIGSINNLIEILETTFKIRVEKQGKTLLLYSK